jgi:hypothetical protein
MENPGIFYGHLEYFAAIWYSFCRLVMLWKFGIFLSVLV